LGRVLMREGLARAARLFPGAPVRIAAQQRLEAFYATLGFRTASAPFDEDGIPHVEMLHAGADSP
jgi:ElaA protein